MLRKPIHTETRVYLQLKRSGQILDEWEFSQTNKNEDYTDF